jgi:hypothetical protein
MNSNILAGNSPAGIQIDALRAGFLHNDAIVSNETAISSYLLLGDSVSLRLINCVVGSAKSAQVQSLDLSDERQMDMQVVNCCIRGGESAILVDADDELSYGPGNIDADPQFVDPGYWDDNGTPDDYSDDTFVMGDYRLLPGSPCIDAGTNDVDNPDTSEVEELPDTDLAGLPRVIDGDLDGTATVDIGAYEFLPGDANYDGTVNILDLIFIRNAMGADPASDPAARKADRNADGAVDVQDMIVVRSGPGGVRPE